MIQFDSKNVFYKDPFGAVTVGTAIAFEILWKNDSTFSRWKQGPITAFLTLEMEGGNSTIFQGEKQKNGFHFSVKPKQEGLYFYRFQIFCGNDLIESSDRFQMTVYSKEFNTPDWLKNGLMYQVFPDRFSRSLASPAPIIHNKFYELHTKWGEAPRVGPDESGALWNYDFFAGNLKGIQEKLPYLKTIGVTVLYLNPIFEAFSNHRYDTANYMKIDPLLGTEEDFQTLCLEASKQGIRVLLDGVFSHTGSHSIYFNQDCAYSETGACQGKDSPYFSWYHFIEFPTKYQSWWGVPTLPEVKEEEKSYLDYVIFNKDSVLRHWIRCGASGFRLDVVDELPDKFLDAFRSIIKEEKKDACIIGEVWEDASNKISYGKRRRYLQGRQLDSVMNYPIRQNMIDFLLGNSTGFALLNQIETLRENYPKQVFDSLMNVLGTHDTPRILTVLKEGSENDEIAMQRLFLALFLWAFLPGIPCIYYGDELGMEGEKDPMNRACFDEANKKEEIFQFYQKILKFRGEISKISEMNFKIGICGIHFFSFERENKEEKICVYINRKNQSMDVPFFFSVSEPLNDFINSGTVRFHSESSSFILEGNSGIAIKIKK